MHSKLIRKTVALFLLATCLAPTVYGQKKQGGRPAGPKILNIVNFIRDIEPRDPNITKDVLYQTVVQQIALMRKHHLGGTFLLQYDALIDKRYQDLLKRLPKDSFEIGAWWELPQPLIEKAGIKWRGKYAWDWHSNVGFSVGYTPQEREKIIDVYFADFRKVFGYYPRSVAAWVIDAASLDYMYDKYKIVASANCKDQYGTDGFTLWGGYWNQAYYPSRINSYMPAQTAGKQLPVPVFRMLGSDPIRQYDDGGSVTTLEPVYAHAGGNETWVNWFLNSFANDPALGFNYTQAGQENSFTWDAMKKGLGFQLPIIEKLSREKKIRVETMAQSGRWFRKTFKVTPATTFTVTKDLPGSDQQTIWYNSRYYRVNIRWKNGNLCIKDIHLFNETIPDKYYTGVTTTNQSYFFTLPVLDSYLWGKTNKNAGLNLLTLQNGTETPVKGGTPVFSETGNAGAHISWPVDNGTFEIDLRENSISISATAMVPAWYFDMNVDTAARPTLASIATQNAGFEFNGHTYHMLAIKGSFEKPGNAAVLRIRPTDNTVEIRFEGR